MLGWLALHLAGATAEGAHFDIRAMGAVHAALFLLAIAALLLALRRFLASRANASSVDSPFWSSPTWPTRVT